MQEIVFTKDELNSIYEVIFNALGKDELSDDEIMWYWKQLPDYIKQDVVHYGVTDTPIQDRMYLWFEENCI